MIPFKARRPLLRSAILLPVTLAAVICLPLLFFTCKIDTPLTMHDKLFDSLLFCVCSVGTLFAFAFFCDSLRNLLAPPTVYVDGNSLRVFGYPEVNIRDIDRTELVPPEKDEKKRGYAAVYVKGSEEPVKITKKLTGMPLNTVLYAVNVRTGASEQ